MAERITLVERMAEARQRKVDERREREGSAFVPTQPFAITQPMTDRAAHRTSFRTTGTAATSPAAGERPVTAPAHGTAWQLSAQCGDTLMLMPGQMHFGAQAARLSTLLGSCVAITLWHPTKRIGGMCHYLLPTRHRKGSEELDGRYGDEAVEAMLRQIKLSGTAPGDYHAHLYGGADTMPEGTPLKFNVGERNIELGWSLIDRHGFQLEGVDVGEDVPRTVTLTLATGAVQMRRGSGRAPATAFSEMP
jgi:chemotaxis protein CheD